MDEVSLKFPIPAPMPLGRLVDLLDGNPSLRTFIRVVVIHDRREDAQSILGTDGSKKDHIFIRFCQALAEQSVEIVRLNIWEGAAKAFPLRPGVLQSMTKLCSGPQLQELSLSSYSPISCLAAARYIKHFTFSNYLSAMEDVTDGSHDLLCTAGSLISGRKASLFSSEASRCLLSYHFHPDPGCIQQYHSSFFDAESMPTDTSGQQPIEHFETEVGELSPTEATPSNGSRSSPRET